MQPTSTLWEKTQAILLVLKEIANRLVHTILGTFRSLITPRCDENMIIDQWDPFTEIFELDHLHVAVVRGSQTSGAGASSDASKRSAGGAGKTE